MLKEPDMTIYFIYLLTRWRCGWIVIRIDCYAQLRDGENDKKPLDHLATDRYCICRIGELFL